MDLKQIVTLALQLSILATVFSFGLKATASDLLYLLRRPGLLARSTIAMFVIVPILAVVLVRVFNFSHAVEVVIIALAISPVPPLLPQREHQARGHAAYGLGLMAIMALLSIIIVPLELAILQTYFGRALSTSPSAIAGLVLNAAILPLLAGMLVRVASPAIADRIMPAVALTAKVVLALAGLVLLAGASSAMWALVGDRTLVALAMFTVIGLIVGHLLGGPDPEHAAVLALSTACRHPAIAFAIASANYPNEPFGPLILLYLLVNVIVALPYLVWRRKTATPIAV
jgi:BASS family bile acid:Na+ symporter